MDVEMKISWNTIVTILRKTYKLAFFTKPIHIVSKEVDSLTKRATFFIKTQRMHIVSKVTTKDIMCSDFYLCSLSVDDRKRVERQYLLEIQQPHAYIEEYPLYPNKENQYIFKILLIETKKIVCGSASHFIQCDKEVLSMLSKQDIVKISMAYYKERFEKNQEYNLESKARTNIHYL